VSTTSGRARCHVRDYAWRDHRRSLRALWKAWAGCWGRALGRDLEGSPPA